MKVICTDCGRRVRLSADEAAEVQVSKFFHGYGLKAWRHRLACDCGCTVFEIVWPAEVSP